MKFYAEKFRYVGYRFLLKDVPYEYRFEIATEYKDKLITYLTKTFNLEYTGYRTSNLYDHMVRSGCFGIFYQLTIRNFNNVEDEAFFLLMANTGIEI